MRSTKLICYFLLATPPLWAQTESARLTGKVADSTGAVIPGAVVTASSERTSGGGSYDNVRFSGRANQQNAVRFDGVEASSIVDA